MAHAIGSVARSIGHSARDLDPAHRRDGVGLFLFGLAMVVAAAVWWQLPGGFMEFMRSAVAGAVGKVGWLVPLCWPVRRAGAPCATPSTTARPAVR